MKKLLRFIAAITLVLPLVVGNVAFAVGDDTTGTDSTSDTNKTLTEEQKTELKKRLAERKAQLKDKLTTAEQARYKAKCKSAQGLISSISGRIKGIETSRGEVYTNIANSLTKLSAKLKEKGLDTTTLDEQIATYQEKVTTFNTDLATYKQAVADLKDMEDCTTDPDAFKAALEEARSARSTTAEDAADIRSYLTDTIKTTLKDLRAQLEAASTDSTETTE